MDPAPPEIPGEQEDKFPAKPALETLDRAANWPRTLFSLLLFMAVFTLIGWDLSIILIVAGVLFFHEAGHFLAMRLFGFSNVNMFFVPLLGAFVSGEKDNVPERQQLVMLFAGPGPGLLASMVILIPEVHGEVQPIFFAGIILFLLNFFNMLPLYPLDGGKIFEILFGGGDLRFRIFLVGLSLVALILYMFFYGFSILAIFGFGLIAVMQNTLEIIRVQGVLDEEGLDYRKGYEELSDEEFWRISERIQENSRNLQIERSPARRVMQVLGTSPENRLRIGGRLFFLLMWLILFIAPLMEVLYFYGDSLRENGII